ncbi:hypothetical protein K458DRAFT_446655 [Lentithecium fluviatile CBS 122367]|uniref:2EXR domain-containing protein n=1 Tax=Lentithecium fluviatile CBS 122367 TaxID=1168545 RepID=A0A6G1IIK2_9PLEO|nr:hypothetical protein K458DRAFT_446655 [Lentithecium fluviatile CBS 122367]
MQAPLNASGQSTLLSLPLELRDHIYSFLLLPQHVYTSSATPETYTIYRSNKDQPTYVDTRIYLPARLSPNILQTCKQLREECLSFHAHHLNSLSPTTVTDPTPPESTLSHKLAARNNTHPDETMERYHDDGVVRITLEILRTFRGTMGFFVPVRDVPSPHFLSFLPLLGRIKKMKFIVWAGYDWWSGNSTRPVISIDRSRRAKPKRTWPDQTDVQQPSVRREDDSIPSQARRPDRLAVAIDTVLQHLPVVEELQVDVLLHATDFTNWDLPEEIKWEGIREWLDGPVSLSAGAQLKKVHRRLIVVHQGPPTISGTFLRQCEIGDGTWDNDDLSVEPSFTESFSRTIEPV